MATLLLATAGAAIGGGLGGTVIGLSGAMIGRAIGATLGQVIDQRLLGSGSERVEIGKLDRFRIMGASEGASVPQLYGRSRVSGQVIWATRFEEHVSRSGGGGKGTPKPKVTQYSYSVSLAIALCEGEIASIGRIWADGVEVPARDLNMRVYEGSADQLPDPKIEAVEGFAPAYRGIAYVVLEDLALGPFGNRVPQFSFEVLRPAQTGQADDAVNLQRGVQAVALVPGTGEYALATTPVHISNGPGVNRSLNVNTPSGQTDLAVSLRHLGEELPAVGSVSLIVSWFGNDLRCGECTVMPCVEQAESDGKPMPWSVAGVSRAQAAVVGRLDDRPVYGGTPTDASVVEAIRATRASGREVMFYPFILMDQLADNGRTDPWSGAKDQPILPWRGRITTSSAPGRDGTTDRTALAEEEVAAFFGTTEPSHFGIAGTRVLYSGPQEWRYRRFILHYAYLCAAAGGVDAFCIGSEMRGLTQIRGAGDSFPAVEALRRLAAEVRAILPKTKISYAADWSEYFGYHQGGDVYFHLDPLWADPAVDFVGIDNYMPLSDWRDGETHADAHWGTIYDLGYLKSNIAGGEGFDWYYDSPEGLAAQNRKPIEDGAHGEHWIYRNKDLKSWWSLPHHDRVGGVRADKPTAWVPGSKPIRFTEYGCAAIDKGTNEPNKFLDPKSSESVLPRASDGRRDDLIQMQYLRAMAEFWTDVDNNPTGQYGDRMVQMQYAHAWAWDARPFPAFPNNTGFWSDGENYARGHWLTGRASSQPLASVVAEICERSGVRAYDVSRLHGIVRGFAPGDIGTARSALQPLMLAYGFEAAERDGLLVFTMRDGRVAVTLEPERLALDTDVEGTLQLARLPEAETAGRVRLAFTEAEGDYSARQAEAIFPDDVDLGVSQTDLPLVLTASEGRRIAERWLAESRVSRDTARFALPRSVAVGAGDVVALDGRRYRIDRMEEGAARLIDAVRVEHAIYTPSDAVEQRLAAKPFVAPVPTHPVFMDLPLLRGDEAPHAPHVAIAATPWPGTVAVWSASEDAGYELDTLVQRPAIVGATQDILAPARVGLWDRGQPLRVRVYGGSLSSASQTQVLNGSNVMAIGDGEKWELFQFANAVLVGEGTYDLSLRLRGQQGTEAAIPAQGWPAGSTVVLLNESVTQTALQPSARGLARHYRVGNAARGYDDPSVVHQVLAFDGVGLRPYAPCHLRATQQGEDIRISWIRRTRIDGDNWSAYEVPLGEERETYILRIVKGDTILREVTVTTPEWTYTAAARRADGATSIAIAQVSDRFGPGPFRSLTL